MTTGQSSNGNGRGRYSLKEIGFGVGVLATLLISIGASWVTLNSRVAAVEARAGGLPTLKDLADLKDAVKCDLDRRLENHAAGELRDIQRVEGLLRDLQSEVKTGFAELRQSVGTLSTEVAVIQRLAKGGAQK